jgi:hypothetical protein
MHQSRSYNIIQINAALLSIFVACFSAYAVYSRSILFNYESEAIQEASKINEIAFIASAYYPDDYPGTLNYEICEILRHERNKYSLRKAPEQFVSKYSDPQNADDLIELFRFLHFLEENQVMSRHRDHYNLGNDKYIPRDSANRAEEVLRVKNLLGHCYLFPSAPLEGAAFSQGLLPKKYFKDMTEVEKWLIDLEVFVLGVKKWKNYMSIGGMIPYQNEDAKQLQKRDAVIIKKWENHRFMVASGHLDPTLLNDDFMKTSEKVQTIAENTRYKFNRFSRIKERFPDNAYLFSIFLSSLIAFLFGILLPIFRSDMPKYLYTHLPLVIIFMLYATVMWWVTELNYLTIPKYISELMKPGTFGSPYL